MSTVATFRALHASGCFLIPNAWDIGSAVLLHHLGFRAIASTSSGYAFTRGLTDRVAATLDNTLDHLRELAGATPLPVNGDFQAGFAPDVEGLATNVKLCVATGVAGLSIEDQTGERDKPLYDRATAIERVRVARAAIDATGVPVVLTARCDAYMVGDPDAERIVFDRCVAFAEAGADCVFATKLPADKLGAFVKAVAPAPVNVVVTMPGGPTVARLAELGVRRISLGSALPRVAWGAFIAAARSIADTGTFDALAGAIPFATLDGIFANR